MVERFGSEDAVQEAVVKELGDILWMLNAVCYEMGTSLEEIANTNIAKLQDRALRNVIKGTGDDR
jgi:NTP pyrophosphatase (non-canonical NTP hydrolase)